MSLTCDLIEVNTMSNSSKIARKEGSAKISNQISLDEYICFSSLCYYLKAALRHNSVLMHTSIKQGC